MGLSNGKKEFERKQMELPKKGPRLAVLTGIVDVGVHKQEYKGQPKPNRREFVPIFTLVKDTYNIYEEDGETVKEKRNHKIMPYGVKHLPGADKGGFYDFAMAMDPDHKILNEDLEGNVFELIGLPCYVTVKHSDPKKDKDGFIYPRFSGISECDEEDLEGLDTDFETVVFDLDSPSPEVFAKLPEHIKGRIRGSVGFVGSDAESVLESGVDPDEEEGDEEPNDIDYDESEVDYAG